MKKILTILLAVIVTGALFASGPSNTRGGGKLTLAQGKPEIDSMLKAYAASWGEKNGVRVTIKSVGGTSGGLGPALKADYAAGDMPDIFAFNGLEAYKDWEALILDLSGEPWVSGTSVAFKYNGKVYGFPVAVEGWGMAYNADLLTMAGIDPETLVNYGAYKVAFEKLDSMKSQLGIDSVVSMAASVEMGWVTAHHNFNSLLSNGLPYGDLSVTNALLAGDVDARRLGEYADWVELLFKYADPSVLLTGNYDAQVGAFAAVKAVFLHQGNWVDPNLKKAGATFKMAFAPHGSLKKDTYGIFVSAPSFYAINKESGNLSMAKKFLTDLALSPEGHNYMVKEAGMIPAFSSISLEPEGQLSQSVQAWAAAGKIYSWNQYYFTGDFRDKVLIPIYNQFAAEEISKKQFIDLMTRAFKENKQ